MNFLFYWLLLNLIFLIPIMMSSINNRLYTLLLVILSLKWIDTTENTKPNYQVNTVICSHETEKRFTPGHEPSSRFRIFDKNDPNIQMFNPDHSCTSICFDDVGQETPGPVIKLNIPPDSTLHYYRPKFRFPSDTKSDDKIRGENVAFTLSSTQKDQKTMVFRYQVMKRGTFFIGTTVNQVLEFETGTPDYLLLNQKSHVLYFFFSDGLSVIDLPFHFAKDKVKDASSEPFFSPSKGIGLEKSWSPVDLSRGVVLEDKLDLLFMFHESNDPSLYIHDGHNPSVIFGRINRFTTQIGGKIYLLGIDNEDFEPEKRIYIKLLALHSDKVILVKVNVFSIYKTFVQNGYSGSDDHSIPEPLEVDVETEVLSTIDIFPNKDVQSFERSMVQRRYSTHLPSTNEATSAPWSIDASCIVLKVNIIKDLEKQETENFLEYYFQFLDFKKRIITCSETFPPCMIMYYYDDRSSSLFTLAPAETENMMILKRLEFDLDYSYTRFRRALAYQSWKYQHDAEAQRLEVESKIKREKVFQTELVGPPLKFWVLFLRWCGIFILLKILSIIRKNKY